MKKFMQLFAVLALFPGCAALTSIGTSARDHAKPAAAPRVFATPISSSQWPGDAQDRFFVTRKDFLIGVNASLFNELTVTYGGQAANELTRGTLVSSTTLSLSPHIDVATLPAGKVSFRLTSLATDADVQSQTWLLEIFDRANVLQNFPAAVSEGDLKIRERSINPRYAGTTDEFKETTVKMVMDPQFVQPSKSGGVSQCRMQFLNGSPQQPSFPPVAPGAMVHFDFSCDGCRQFMIAGRHPGTSATLFGVPSVAHQSHVVANVQISTSVRTQEILTITGWDQMGRKTFTRIDQHIQAPQGGTPACDTQNGFSGQMHNFQFCASCDNDVRVNVGATTCTDAEARTQADDTLTKNGGTGCSLEVGACTICPKTSSNPAGVAGAFPFCAITTSPSFGYFDMHDGLVPACSRQDADDALARAFAGYETEPALGQTFSICATCPGSGPASEYIQSCTLDQAIVIKRANLANQGRTGCTVAKCP